VYREHEPGENSHRQISAIKVSSTTNIAAGRGHRARPARVEGVGSQSRSMDVSKRPILDHYRCPEGIADFELAGKLRDDRGFFCFGPETICYGRSSSGSRSEQPNGPLYDARDDVTASSGTVCLPFEPSEIIENLRYERYRKNGDGNGNGLHRGSMARRLYYSLRPFLPVSIRRHIQRAYLSNWKNISFPQWPVDRTVDRCLDRLLALSMRAQGLQTLPFVWFWPDGAASCTIMTHDVEHLSGRNFCSQLMDLDDAVGIKSSFQIVPEGRYPVPDSLLDDIRQRGFEINVHDLNHNGRLFSSREEFGRAAERINAYGRQFGAAGFRSGALYRNQAWFDELDFSYDMSVPSVAHLDPQRGGCCTITPFFIGRRLELPVTTTQDYTLFHILNDYSIELWQRQIAAITEHHGLASFIVHPDYVIAKRARATYQALLEHLARVRDDGQTWMALPHEVDEWWRQRSQMSIVRNGRRWLIQGAGKERARLAYATRVGDTLDFSVDDGNSPCKATLAG